MTDEVPEFYCRAWSGSQQTMGRLRRLRQGLQGQVRIAWPGEHQRQAVPLHWRADQRHEPPHWATALQGRETWPRSRNGLGRRHDRLPRRRSGCGWRAAWGPGLRLAQPETVCLRSVRASGEGPCGAGWRTCESWLSCRHARPLPLQHRPHRQLHTGWALKVDGIIRRSGPSLIPLGTTLTRGRRRTAAEPNTPKNVVPRGRSTWLTTPTDKALKLQKPAPDDAVIVLSEETRAA